MNARANARAGALLAAGLLSRSRPIWWSAAVLAMAVALVHLVFASVASFTLSPAQLADREFGTAGERASVVVLAGDPEPDFLQAAQASLDENGISGDIAVETTQIRPDALANRFVRAPLDTLRYVEDPQLRGMNPGRYELLEGAWPREPNEVLLSPELAGALPEADTFTVQSKRAEFETVGIVRDSFATRAQIIVAAPGTFGRLPAPVAGRSFQPTDANLILGFSTQTAPTGSYEQQSEILGPLLRRQPRELAAAFESTRSDRSAAAETAGPSFGDGQVAVSFFPIALLALMASTVAAFYLRQSTRQRLATLRAIGVRPGVAVGSHVLASLVAAIIAVGLGLAFGLLATLILRSIVWAQVADQPLSPALGPSRPVLLVAGLCVLVFVTVQVRGIGVGVSRVGGWRRRSQAALAHLHLASLRRAAAVLLMVGAWQVGGRPESVDASYLAVAGVALLAPDALRGCLAVLSRSRGPRSLVSERLLRAPGSASGIAVFLIACCVAIPLCVASQLQSKQASDATFTYSFIPDGQIWVEGGGRGDVGGVAAVVETVPGLSEPVAVSGVTFTGPRSRAAFFSKEPTSAFSNAGTAVVDTVEQVEVVLDATLPGEAREALDSGGVIDLTNAVGDQQFVVLASSGRQISISDELPTAKLAVGRSISGQFGGVVLTRTARDLGLPIKSPTSYVFPDVDTDMIARSVQAAVDAGYDSQFVQYRTPVPTPTVPLYATAFLICLLMAGGALLVVVVRGRARQLRSHVAGLHALGIGRTFVRRVLLLQSSAIVVAGVVIGVLAGGAGLLALSDAFVVLSVPVWSSIVGVAVVVVTTMGTAALSRLRAT